jgi:hypothetical protein
VLGGTLKNKFVQVVSISIQVVARIEEKGTLEREMRSLREVVFAPEIPRLMLTLDRATAVSVEKYASSRIQVVPAWAWMLAGPGD